VFYFNFYLFFVAIALSRSITLTTYYPAPSGVYRNLTTTQDTYLATDSGNVGIDTDTPTSAANPNGNTNGNLDVNDIWLRDANGGAGEWASQEGDGATIDYTDCEIITQGSSWANCSPDYICVGANF